MTFEALHQFKIPNHKLNTESERYLCHEDNFKLDINLQVLFTLSRIDQLISICLSIFLHSSRTVEQMLVSDGKHNGSYGSLLDLLERHKTPCTSATISGDLVSATKMRLLWGPSAREISKK